MKMDTPKAFHFIKKRFSFIRENNRIIIRFIFAVFFIGLGIWFIKNEQSEIHQVKEALGTSSWLWVSGGIVVTVLYILLQAQMYRASFAALSSSINLRDATILFLKRNFVSVFLPMGGVSSLAFFSREIEQKGVSKTQINFASSLYGFVGILSVVVIGIPVFLYAALQGNVGKDEWVGLIAILVAISLVYLLYKNLKGRGRIYKLAAKYMPFIEIFVSELQSHRVDKRQFINTIIYSLLIEVTGIAHVYIAMVALNLEPSVLAASVAYIVSVCFLMVSPFMRGLGAIEVSMAYILSRSGYTEVAAISVTFLYRFFEFWLPLIAGAATFILKINKLLLRVLPAILLMLLGILNIVSVLTPAIKERVKFLRGFLPNDAIAASNYFVLGAGIFLLVTATFMLKGLRTAWYFAISLAMFSFVGHLTKGADYEEATLSLLVIFILIISRKEYYIRNNPALRSVGVKTTAISIVAVLLYGIIGFYFLDKHHFNNDFSLVEAVKYTLENFVLLNISDLVPRDAFARGFLYSINISGFLSLAFLTYTLIRPYVMSNRSDIEDLEHARLLTDKYGKSALDFFKTYSDKLIFTNEHMDAYIAYRVTGNFAVVLENPVASDEIAMQDCIISFDKYCYENGLKSLYYRVPEESLEIYKLLGKKKLFLGQEAVVNLSEFSVETSKKSIRNALKKVTDRGYKSKIYTPPVKDGLLQKLKSVSNEWLTSTGRSEIIFSQGMFVAEELKAQTIITVENDEEKIVAFMNIVPDYVPGEATYDLIRKTEDAPNGIMDFIIIALFNYLKENGYHSVNMGFAPLSGIDDAHTFPEKSMKFAYEKIRSFAHYKGLRDFKDKFSPTWKDKYLVYANDYDLLQAPIALNNVIKPPAK